MKIHLLSNDQTSQFAADELEAYLIRMGCPDLTYCLSVSDSVMSASPAACETHADHTEGNPASSINEKPAETLRQDQDDSYAIHVSADGGRILGSNPRALLLGVYRYLTLIGCRFLRPGREWEIVPVLTAPEQFYACETCAAELRHRGVCLEGADSIENILDFIDWSPKIGFNSFFLQFKYPHTFLKRWYSHENNPDLTPQSWTMEDSMRVMPYLSKAMEKRGLLQHRVGHGWTGEVHGCKATGWEKEVLSLAPSNHKSENSTADPEDSTTSPWSSTANSKDSNTDSKDSNTDSSDSTTEIRFAKNRSEKEQPSAAEPRSLIAEVNGKRELFQGIPTNTNLCLSNPVAVEHLVDRVVLYLQENPQTDYLHIWMADGCNNFCECENCRKLRPSDHYIALLNRIDERLCEQNIPTRIVLLLYMDLLWSPLEARLHHPERFVLMFAPITRTFEESYADHDFLVPVPEFHLNHLSFPSDLETYLAFLREWQEKAPCDGFVYDYYLGRAHYGDPAYAGISRIIHRDLACNRALRLNGIISCQELRAAFPNALPNYVMARTAFDPSLSFEEIAREYYEATYGTDGWELFTLMDRISALFSTDYILQKGERRNPDIAKRMTEVPQILDEIRLLSERQRQLQYQVQEHMWQELSYFIDLTDITARMIGEAAAGNSQTAMQIFRDEYQPFVRRFEQIDQAALDGFRIQNIVGGAIRG